jgi:site-specific recombinase XerD
MTPVDREVWQFDNHLDQAGGLALNTRLYRRRYVRQFLSHLFGCGPFEPEKIKPRHVMDFAANQAAARKPGTAKVIVGALKSYFKYLQLRGLCDLQLLSAVPTIPFWKLAGIPKTVAAQDLDRFLKTFDRSTATGRRDFAMALCMNECGLRACEISHLHLRDINWRLGILNVPKSKTHRSRHLPLTPRLGQAISDYLRNGRPNSSEHGLFLRHRAPYDPISDGIVRGALRRSYERSGATPWSGPHALRHTLAARLMEGGVPIKEVADVLGHTSIDTTAIYAKVNLAMLKQVAMPWPKGGNS